MKIKLSLSAIAVAGILALMNFSGSSATMLEEELDGLTLIKGRLHQLDESSVEGGLSITFSQILAESRCPAGVQCIWAGEVAVELVFEKSGAIYREKLVLPGAGDPKPRELHGYRVTLLEVYPFPELDAPEPAPEEIKIVINLKKL